MTRRLATDRCPRRLLRMRPAPRRLEHGFDVALVAPAVAEETAHRSGAQALRALAEENALLARELGRVQARCTRWRDDCVAQADRLDALLMRARGALMAKETELAAARDALDSLQRRAAAWRSQEELVRRIADLRARNRMLEAELERTLRPAGEVPPASGPAQVVPLPPSAGVPQLASRRVLCVGGRARQIPVYRDLVERSGGHFTHVDGSASGCLRALQRVLAGADLVVLQPAFVCQRACQLVESHCRQRGIRCVRLEKTCARGFVEGLAHALFPS